MSCGYCVSVRFGGIKRFHSLHMVRCGEWGKGEAEGQTLRTMLNTKVGFLCGYTIEAGIKGRHRLDAQSCLHQRKVQCAAFVATAQPICLAAVTHTHHTHSQVAPPHTHKHTTNPHSLCGTTARRVCGCCPSGNPTQLKNNMHICTIHCTHNHTHSLCGTTRPRVCGCCPTPRARWGWCSPRSAARRISPTRQVGVGLMLYCGLYAMHGCCHACLWSLARRIPHTRQVRALLLQAYLWVGAHISAAGTLLTTGNTSHNNAHASVLMWAPTASGPVRAWLLTDSPRAARQQLTILQYAAHTQPHRCCHVCAGGVGAGARLAAY